LIQDQGELRNLDSKISLPGFHRFKFQFHSFFAETFSTVSVRFGHSAMSAQFPHCPKADVDPRSCDVAQVQLKSVERTRGHVVAS
jgi:hypothetical protein